MKNTNAKKEILEIYNALRKSKNVKPGERNNRLFTSLVQLTSKYDDISQDILKDKEIRRIIPSMRRICSKGEYELEKFWSQRIAASDHPMIQLERFPYYDNYEQLTNLEVQSIKILGEREIGRVLFVGSGPLPLSSIILSRNFNINVDNLDVDRDATRISKKLIEKVGLTRRQKFYNKNILDFKEMKEYDVIFLASLVGKSIKEKLEIINHIKKHMRNGSILVIRSANNLKMLLYPDIPLDRVHLKKHAIIHPLNEIINSVIITQKEFGDSLKFDVKDKNSGDKVFSDFKRFAFNIVNNVYGYPYNPIWHNDIDKPETVYNTEKSNIFLVYLGNEVVASAAIRPYDKDYRALKDRYRHENVAGIWRFFVKDAYKNLGIEKILHRHIESFARANGFSVLYSHEQKTVKSSLRKYIDHGYIPTYEENDDLGTIHLEKVVKNE